jgi:hypothetical protein
MKASLTAGSIRSEPKGSGHFEVEASSSGRYEITFHLDPLLTGQRSGIRAFSPFFVDAKCLDI